MWPGSRLCYGAGDAHGVGRLCWPYIGDSLDRRAQGQRNRIASPESDYKTQEPEQLARQREKYLSSSFMNWVKVGQQLPHIDHNTTGAPNNTAHTPNIGNGGNGIDIIGGTASDH
jgi:hypothetical protein